MITSLNSDQMTLTAAPAPVKTRFSPYPLSLNPVTHPSGSNLIARVTNAFIEAVRFVGHAFYNAVVWAPNKIYNILYPNAVNNIAVDGMDDDITIRQDSAVISFYDDSSEQAAESNGLPQPVVEVEESLLEPIALKNPTWQKTALIGGGVFAGATALLFVNHYNQYIKVPYVDDLLTNMASHVNSAKDNIQRTWTSWRTGLPKCTPDLIDTLKKLPEYQTCPTTEQACDLTKFQESFIAKNCVV